MLPSFLSHFWEQEPQLFRFWTTLTQPQKEALIHQLSHIQLDVLKQQKQLIHNSSVDPMDSFESFDEFAFSGNLDLQVKGQQLIEQGRLGCLLLAGGQGTRLGHSGPKGTYPISIIKHKSLFQLCAEKIKAASLKAKRPLQLAIMTAPDNDEESRSFFQIHHYFGLDPTQVAFFVQETLPFLDSKGHLFLQTPCQLAEGSNGNGNSLHSFAQSDVFNQWKQQGVEYMHVILVDNPLADPFDAELLGFHSDQGAEITLKCTEKMKSEEKVGLLVKQDNNCRVVEYSEISDQEKEAKRLDGRLKHCCANLSLFCFSLSFIQQIVANRQTIPLHKAWKSASYLDDKGATHLSIKPNAWKFETFIFDWLIYAKKVSALIYPREHCFAPLKNAQGPDSPETVRAALQQADKRIIQEITGLKAPDFPFELASEFYYPSYELLKKWNGKAVLNSYVEP